MTMGCLFSCMRRWLLSSMRWQRCGSSPPRDDSDERGRLQGSRAQRLLGGEEEMVVPVRGLN
jgi:hypothetical protein